jgi:ligand-binding sensor domain-containing protein/signal transduction histidine kinase
MKMHASRLFPLLLILTLACSPTLKADNTPEAEPAPLIQPVDPAITPPITEHIHFGRVSVDDGLSQSSVMSIVQDKRGFMWFGTEDGLNRYDGVEFKVFRPIEGDSSSLSDVWVRSLVLDAKGELWAGTRQGGANRYNDVTGTFTQYQHDDAVADSLSHNNVRSIFPDAQGRLWFGTNLTLDLFDPESGGFEHFLPPDVKELAVQAIAQDSKGNLWLGTLSGLWHFNPDQKMFSSYATDEKEMPIFSVLPNEDGTLWLGTIGDGLLHYDPQTQKFKQYLPKNGLSNETVTNLWRDPSGRIWAATAYGLNLFDPLSGSFIEYVNDPIVTTTLSTNFIHTLYQDRSGILWIGTYGGGVNTYDPLANKFTHIYSEPKNPKSLSNNMVFSIAPDPNGTVWIGTMGGGLEHYDPATDTFTHYRHNPKNENSLQNDYVECIRIARNGLIWIGTDSGLDRFDPKSGAFTHFAYNVDDPASLPGTTVTTIYQDSADTLWVGTGNGLARYDASTQTFSRYMETEDATGLNDGYVTSILEDHNGKLWVGTFSGGASRFDPQTGNFTHYRHDAAKPDSISYDSIISIYESQSGTLWFGSGGGGLNRYDPATNSFTAYRDADGLPNDVVYGILEDEVGNLWLSTNFGVARFNPQTGASTNYTTADGLQSNEFNIGAFGKSADGRMYFGGINGLTQFYPSNVIENRFVPPLSLVAVTQNGIPLRAGKEPEVLDAITLKYPNNSFEFKFAALSYFKSSQNQYAYQLEGFDGEWYYAGTERTGRYSNLPGGEYTLRLKAANADGIWNETGISLKVTVIPPFWETWWFYSLIALTVFSGVAGIYRWRIHDVETQKRKLERQVNERAKEIERLFEQNKELAVVEERNRLARDLHDSAKQKAFAALAQLGAARSLTNGSGEKAEKHLQEAETLVSEVIQEITFLIQEIYPAALKEKGLSTALREYIFEWSNRTGIHVDLKIEGEQRLALEIEQAIYRTIQEALANVARHSAASMVTLALSIQSADVSVSLSDDGHGFDVKNTENGMGLRSIRDRVESIGGAFHIESTVGKGTLIAIRIPLA